MSRLFAALESRVWECVQKRATDSDEGSVTDGFALGITSAVTGEGKTMVALHLAMHIATNTFNRVCLIDLSLSEDEYSRRLGLPAPRQGLTNILEQRDQMFSALQVRDGDGPVIMLAGRAPANPARAARSPRVRDLIRAAREMFDLVIVELPAIFTENALPLVMQMDGLAMVTRAGATPDHVVNRALDHVGRTRVLGVVLNGIKFAGPRWLQGRLLGR